MTDASSKHPATVTGRGFKVYPKLITDYGHVLQVWESSAAKGPCLWFRVEGEGTDNQEDGQFNVHLTVEQAKTLRKMLKLAIEGHYQNG